MENLAGLKKEVDERPEKTAYIRNRLLAEGFAAHMDEENVLARAYALKSLLENHEKHIYPHDLVAGSLRGLLAEESAALQTACADRVVGSFGERGFLTNSDHFAPDYETLVTIGVGGIREKIRRSLESHAQDGDFPRKRCFLQAADICMEAFGNMIRGYGEAAAQAGNQAMAAACRAVAQGAPATFREALQLVWLAHVSFVYEGRYAMALGRLDQYLYPFYRADRERGSLSQEEALELLACTLYKIHERQYLGGDDVVNIAIGGVRPEDGGDAVNELSFLILRAVEACNIPGPNLSARLHKGVSEEFLDACLQVIGTGLGYPALMNDDVNIPALLRHGYSLEDCRNYCMVGCIENFIPGKQPPWSDGRYNTPKYVELALNNGVCMLTGQRRGPRTGEAAALDTMDKFMAALEEQMRYGAAEYMLFFRNENDRYNREAYMQPYLSCFCRDCIGRGLDINNGGAAYPSAHGAGCMGIATVADSLAAVRRVVYEERFVTLEELRRALLADFEGYETLRARLLQAPKYGNDDEYVDRYAVWFVDYQNRLFSRYRTPDGGPVYTAIASNVDNIPAGREIAATPDGRKSREPVSDAASPMHGADKNGPTAVIHSLTRPDYRLVSCGTVVNQKYSPDMFRNPEKRAKLAALIRSYFLKGGQEIQINAVSRETLLDAMEHPEDYRSLVVRVSGFSAYYTLLSKEVQKDILQRTEHG